MLSLFRAGPERATKRLEFCSAGKEMPIFLYWSLVGGPLSFFQSRLGVP